MLVLFGWGDGRNYMLDDKKTWDKMSLDKMCKIDY